MLLIKFIFFSQHPTTTSFRDVWRLPLGSLCSPGLANHSALFQQIDGHSGAGHSTAGTERHLQELAEAGRVAVDAGGGVAERLHDGVGGQDALLDAAPACLAQGDQLAQEVVGRLGLPGPTLSGDHHALVLSVPERRKPRGGL